jgi:hypothetical protein
MRCNGYPVGPLDKRATALVGHAGVKTTEVYLTPGYLTFEQIETAKKAVPTALAGFMRSVRTRG